MNIFYQKLNELAQEPTYATSHDFGCDVIATSEKEIFPNVWQYGLGFKYEFDRESFEKDINKLLNGKSFVSFPGHMVNLNSNWLISLDGRPKSSIYKHGMILANCTATLDEFYRNEVKAIFYHVMPNLPRYKVGDQVIQLMISLAPKINWIEKDYISEDTERGTNGFGKQDEINQQK